MSRLSKTPRILILAVAAVASLTLLSPADVSAQSHGHGGGGGGGGGGGQHGGGGQGGSGGGHGGGGGGGYHGGGYHGGGYHGGGYYGHGYYGHGYYRPAYYRPYFYNPFWGYAGWYPYASWYGGFGFGFGFGWGAYGYGYPYAYGYPYGYGAYGYPYGYGWGGYDPAASVRIQATPREAQVYLDGYFVGVVDDFDGFSQRLRLVPGEHEVTLYLPGFKSVTDKLLFRPRQSYKMHFELQKLAPGDPPPTKPIPSPTARRPTVDDPDQFPMPGDTESRAPATGRSGRAAARRTGRRRRALSLRQIRAAASSGMSRSESYGTLSVRVQPADAVITIDGERWDTPSGAMRLTVDLRAWHASHRNPQGGLRSVHLRGDGQSRRCHTAQCQPEWRT